MRERVIRCESLRIQLDTIFRKDFIEAFFDGQLVVTVEAQSLAIGQLGSWFADKRR
ncbi:MAG: hypothetical protein L0Z46_06255 [Nitrospiraceae bacterium]|nr:hypothetical protein [Nitrospiraceae bacterium]